MNKNIKEYANKYIYSNQEITNKIQFLIPIHDLLNIIGEYVNTPNLENPKRNETIVFENFKDLIPDLEKHFSFAKPFDYMLEPDAVTFICKEFTVTSVNLRMFHFIPWLLAESTFIQTMYMIFDHCQHEKQDPILLLAKLCLIILKHTKCCEKEILAAYIVISLFTETRKKKRWQNIDLNEDVVIKELSQNIQLPEDKIIEELWKKIVDSDWIIAFFLKATYRKNEMQQLREFSKGTEAHKYFKRLKNNRLQKKKDNTLQKFHDGYHLLWNEQ